MKNELLINSVPLESVFHDQNGDPFARFYDGKRIQVTPIRGRDFRRYILYSHFCVTGSGLKEKDIDEIVIDIEARALFEGPKRELEVRCSTEEGKIFYDGIDYSVEISRDGWSIIPLPPIVFRRYAGLKAQVPPERGGSFDDLFDLFNIKSDTDKILIKTFVVSAFLPNIPHPVLALHGPQGSGKSMLLRFLVNLIDPCTVEDIQNMEQRELFQAIAHRWLVPFDNLTEISSKVSDIICKLVTGASFSKRRLYSDEDDLIWSLRRVVILNGVNLPVNKPDLLDRCIIIELNRIGESERVSEKVLNKKFKELRPKVLGACFDLISKALGTHENIELPWRPRLADYAIWSEAITQACGLEPEVFLNAFKENKERQDYESLDASALATVIQHFVDDEGHFEGTATTLLRKLRDVAEQAGVEIRELPKSPRSLGRRIQEVKPSLEAIGIIVNQTRGQSRILQIFPKKLEKLYV